MIDSDRINQLEQIERKLSKLNQQLFKLRVTAGQIFIILSGLAIFWLEPESVWFAKTVILVGLVLSISILASHVEE